MTYNKLKLKKQISKLLPLILTSLEPADTGNLFASLALADKNTTSKNKLVQLEQSSNKWAGGQTLIKIR